MALGTIGTAIATGIGGSLASRAFGGDKKTATSTAEPWGAAQHHLMRNITDTETLYDQGRLAPTPYGGRRVAGFSPETDRALKQMGQPSALNAPSIANLTDMMSGENMYRDFDRIRDTVGGNVKAQLANTFAGGGINSSLAQDTYTRALGDALAQVEYGAYNDAQNRRLSALGLAPSIAGMELADERAALGAGVMRDDLAQRQIDADMAKYYETEDQDYEALRRYAGISMGVGGMGGSSNSTQPVSFWNETLPGMGRFASGIGGLVEANNANGGDGGFWASLFGGGE